MKQWQEIAIHFSEPNTEPGRLITHIETIEAQQQQELQSLVIYYSFAETLWGNILIASTTQGICYLGFADNSRDTALQDFTTRFPNGEFRLKRDSQQEKVIQYLTNNKHCLKEIRLHLFGTTFQRNVWIALLSIPCGGFSTYREITHQTASGNAYRAVGTAIGNNPISILIPCHRVICANGQIGGYHWGKERKMEILRWEQDCDTSSLF